MSIEVNIVSAFCEGEFGGNPAGVVLNADYLSKSNKLAIAKKIGLSETAFISESTSAGYKLDFFTPNRQIAHCGHATIATFGLLLEQGLIADNSQTSKETIDGNREIYIKNTKAFMQQNAPSYKPVSKLYTEIEESLGIKSSNWLNTPKVVNTGNSFLVLGLPTEKALLDIKPDFNLINKISEQLNLIGYYIFTLETRGSADAATRMFAPRYGITEESATGMAAGPLSCYLYDVMNIKKSDYLIEQGYLMHKPSPSLIQIELKIKNNSIFSLLAGGTARLMEKRTLEI